MAIGRQRCSAFMDGVTAPEPAALASTGITRIGVLRLEPFNFAIPILGVVDDLFLLPLLLHGLARIAVYVTRLPMTSASRDDRVVSVQ
jgi:hypothetical protein